MSNLLCFLGKAFGVVLMVIALTSTSYAESYKVQIKKVTPMSETGDVVLLFKPGTKEDGFTGKAKGVLLGTDIGTNQSLAVILTAVSLGAEVILEMESPPTYDFIQVINSTGMPVPKVQP